MPHDTRNMRALTPRKDARKNIGRLEGQEVNQRPLVGDAPNNGDFWLSRFQQESGSQVCSAICSLPSLFGMVIAAKAEWVEAERQRVQDSLL